MQHALPAWLSSRQGLKQVAGEQPPLGCLAKAQPPTFLTLHESSCGLEKVKHGGQPRAKSCCRPTHSCCWSPEAGLTAVVTVDRSDRFRIKQTISRRRHEKWHFFEAQIKHHNTSLEPRFICCSAGTEPRGGPSTNTSESSPPSLQLMCSCPALRGALKLWRLQ